MMIIGELIAVEINVVSGACGRQSGFGAQGQANKASSAIFFPCDNLNVDLPIFGPVNIPDIVENTGAMISGAIVETPARVPVVDELLNGRPRHSLCAM
ncbi:hypothetical protein ABK730_02865 [Klebsiella indica]|uniref:hypothetical protein n=1 Tax=Klebsiella TaxID=570 RepID=UPI0031B6F29E